MTTDTDRTETARTDHSTTDAFVERFFSAVLGAQFTQAAYLGDRLGWYRALADAGALTSVELAARTATAERYAREWLEHQAVCGVLTVDNADDAAAAPQQRRFRLSAGHAEVLTSEESLSYLMPLARMMVGLGKHMDALLDAYRTGGGVSWAEFGEDPREAQGAQNRPMFLRALGTDYLPRVPEVHAELRAGGRVADIGCGLGWSSIGIALAYPGAAVDGFDLDGPSVETATRNAHEAGVSDRVRFHHVEASAVTTPLTEQTYDLVTAFECVHDLPDPVSFLATMRRLAGDTGTVMVMDERVAETFDAPGDETEQLMYGFSLMCCLPDGLSHQPSEGTGTVMRPAVLEGYARRAGFAGIEVLPIEDDFFRFYRLA
ncbi:MAG: methyltransferase domain-containing protein [Pseudonocardiaceae bacterium]|nr:methyltransferase domain-containing protein [Pseudonocardiaceae bacterium]